MSTNLSRSPAPATRQENETPAVRARWLRNIDWHDYFILIAFVAVFILFSIIFSGNGFLTGYNLLNILRQTATVTILAVAMTFVIGCAEIDLSVGSVEGLASVVAALGLLHYGLWAGLLGGLLVGLVAGVINGILVVYVRIPSFLVTLAMLGGALGLAMQISNTNSVLFTNNAFEKWFGGGNIGPIPSIVLWSIVVAVVGFVVMRYTTYGRKVLATGGSQTAARYTGINIRRIRFSVMLLSAFAAALAGILIAGRLASGRFEWGTGDELSAIAAVILGGTSLFGGQASILGSILGSLLLGLIDNGLLLGNIGAAGQMMLQALIIVVAVAFGKRGRAE